MLRGRAERRIPYAGDKFVEPGLRRFGDTAENVSKATKAPPGPVLGQ